ncbi:DNA-binding protein HU-beta [Tamilnaduibacter salinus]|uniref:DNA-binding protein HU-beta n=1 Tax=Tamilnaduibacter salinus TaxID=1484056 RepID=A0A2U1CV81_9GAMM|nr:HU family DNA-binding protein [Tamilnaduibacter salinus]PVY75386.1 DNA-binding protein HU-beta [Tamilnaduibacter salinus]
MEFSPTVCDSREVPKKKKPTNNIFNLKSKGFSVNKSELIDEIAASADISKAGAGRALDAMVDSITGALKKGDQVTLIGFGTFSVKERAARTGRNPQTGQEIKIPASKVPNFKAGKALKDSVK